MLSCCGADMTPEHHDSVFALLLRVRADSSVPEHLFTKTEIRQIARTLTAIPRAEAANNILVRIPIQHTRIYEWNR